MIYLLRRHYEKTQCAPSSSIGLGFVLALFSAASHLFHAARHGSEPFGAARFSCHPRQPHSQDLSEIGSTDGIVVMGLHYRSDRIVPILLTGNPGWNTIVLSAIV